MANRTFDAKKDVADMKGKVVIVTGGNKGIGLSTVRHLLCTNAKVYLAARNESKAVAAISTLHEEGLGQGGEHGLGEVIWLKLDLSDPRDAQKAADEFTKTESRLDVLINNAGGIFPGISADGVSNMHIVNYISPYVFTRALLPLLIKTSLEPDSDVRIVNVSSKLQSLVPSAVQFKDIDDFNIPYTYRPFSSFHRYGHSKLAVTLWSRHLQHRLVPSPHTSPNGIAVISLHPGTVDTISSSTMFPSFMALVLRYLANMVDTDTGALTSVFAAIGKEVRADWDTYGEGVYLVESPVAGTVKDLNGGPGGDEKLAGDLVDVTEAFLKGIGLE